MPRPQRFDIDPADVDPDGLADGNSSAGASVTLDGALTSGGSFTSADGLGRKILITDVGADDQSGATYTITGTSANDLAQSESLAGPTSGGNVSSTKYYKTVTSITIASPVAGSSVDIGTEDEAASPVYLLNWRSEHPATVAISQASGTFSVDIEETFDPIGDGTVLMNDVSFSEPASDKSANDAFALTRHATGVRVHFDSYTAGAEFQFDILQSNH